ncbi:uncharacterized protein BDZ99DRAFT_348480, partial [Mytilinidion resinicola]
PAPTKPAPKLEKRQSKMSLFNLFSRPNVEKARGHHESGLAMYEAQQQKLESKQDLSMLEGDADIKKFDKGKTAHKRLVSASIMNPPDLTTKVYVLVTSGYVLQYAGEGPSDRLPEKILQLGTESAAFACDLIPGKHWVLQISQSAKEDGTVSSFPAKSLLSRLRLQSSGAKRTASSFFLIMESAEEMDTWLTAVRREIDTLGGMKCRTESDPLPSTEPAVETGLRHRPSHRYNVHRDPNRFGNSQSPINSPVQSPIDSPIIVTQNWEGSR